MVPLKFPPLIKESKINIKICNKINKSIDKGTNMYYNKNIKILKPKEIKYASNNY